MYDLNLICKYIALILQCMNSTILNSVLWLLLLSRLVHLTPAWAGDFNGSYTTPEESSTVC